MNAIPLEHGLALASVLFALGPVSYTHLDVYKRQVLLAVVICGALLSWVERRLLGLWQDRYGPNRVGPFGAFQLGADMVKMFFKEDWTPPFADKMIFTLAPVIAMGALLVAFAIVPITPTWGVADLNIGILFFFAMAGLTVYAVLFAGWSSNNKFCLLYTSRCV